MDEGQKKLEALKSINERCADLARDIAHDARHDESDHFAFMCLCFLSKQLEHLYSLHSLFPGRDQMLLARVMIDGFAQLAWAKDDDRAEHWRFFAVVSDWRQMRLKQKEGWPVSDQECSRIEDAIDQYGDRYFSRPTRKAISSDEPLPDDPYTRSWLGGTQLRQILQQLDIDELYVFAYQPFSAWAHWESGAIGGALDRKDNELSYKLHPAQFAESALKMAFLALWHTASFTNAALHRGFEDKLESLKQEIAEDE